jgi:hypothetical protein
MNLVDAQAAPAQRAMLEIAREESQSTLREAAKLTAPRHHEVRAKDVNLKRLGAVFWRWLMNATYETLLLCCCWKILGQGHFNRLAPSRFSDPARFSFALGGKDRHPFPVPLKT